MYQINKIPYDFKIREEALSGISNIFHEPEMTVSESAFLCGLMEKYQPSKVLELGTAAGATSQIMLTCLEKMGKDFEMYSVDLAEQYYRDTTKKVGFLIKENVRHHLMLGKVLPDWIEQIGGGIDFVLLDTVHILPGEVLEFLALLPYLKNGAVVCLHDISLNQRAFWGLSIDSKDYCATSILFQAVNGDHILNYVPENRRNKILYPSIGAFIVDEGTRDSIINVFFALTMRWGYSPSHLQLNSYRKIIYKQYDTELCTLFEEAVDMNLWNIYPFPFQTINRNDRILIYGGGNIGRSYVKQLLQAGYTDLIWTDKSYYSLNKENEIKELVSFESALQENPTKVVIAIAPENIVREVYARLIDKGFDRKQIVWAMQTFAGFAEEQNF